MSQISMKYFRDHVPESVFDNQADLANHLAKIGKRIIIESDELNPLTVRLFNAKLALKNMEEFTKRLKPKGLLSEFSDYKLYQGPAPKTELYSSTAPSGSVVYAHSCTTPCEGWAKDPSSIQSFPYQIQHLPDNQLRFIDTSDLVHSFELHINIFTYFANIDSIFDRIRLEINSIYFDGEKKIRESDGNKYWYQYLKPTNEKVEKLKSAKMKISDVILHLDTCNLDQRTSKYRDRLIHDGILDIYINRTTGKISLPDDPDSATSNYNVELLPYVAMVFDDLQKLLRNVYEAIILDIQGKSSLPVI